jgi:MtN3 and saliva related transmembrane protein
MDYITAIGFAASVLGAIAFFPQLMKAWKTKSTRDISLVMFSIGCVGFLLWLAYGILTNDLPVIIANIVMFIQAFVILMLKLKYK